MEPIPSLSGAKQLHGPRRRNRNALSCEHCRFRKLKCNRATPCGACVKAGDAGTCSYSRGRRCEDQPPSEGLDRNILVTRIDRLENLLMSVMSKETFEQSSPAAPTIGPSPLSEISTGTSNIPENHKSQIGQEIGREGNLNMEELRAELGVLKVEPNSTLYHGGQHLVSIMFQIQEFREYLEANSDDLGRVAVENKRNENVINLLDGTNERPTKEELLSYLPGRGEMDVLIERFFRCVHHNIPVVHEPTFRREYIHHWNNPNQTDATWLGLLFSILNHADLASDSNDENNLQARIAGYRERTIQSLIIADYKNPQIYTIEVLILHTFAEWMSSADSSTSVSLLLGITVRLAMRMGMHRDSGPRDGLTPFQGEMRRRVWAVLRQMDIICSFQLSLPALIHPGDSRCSLPRNIYNIEFDKVSKGLPIARGLNEATEISYSIIKTKLTLELGAILAFAEEEDAPTNVEISKFEQSLENVKRAIPPHLQLFCLLFPELAPQRSSLDRVYQASLCILHRRSLRTARQNPSKLHQRGICISAAMTLLDYQTTIYSNFPSSLPQYKRKRHIHTLTTHDFFISSLAVSLDLYYGFESEPIFPSPSDVALWGYDRREEMITALERSNEFCGESKDQSVEAANAWGMFSFVVAKAKRALQMILEQQNQTGRCSRSEKWTGNKDEYVTSIFDEALPDFDWGLWNQFNGEYEDMQSLTQWEDVGYNPIQNNGDLFN